jgi:opine dehydrogenase
MKKNTKFAILGAGNGGLAMAGDLVLHGHTVSGLYDRFAAAIEPIQKRGGIEMVGQVMTGFAPIANATTDMGKAVAGADVITIVVPAFAHEWMAANLAPHLTDGQTVLLTPGYPGGTLAFRQTLQASGLKAKIDLAETNLILYSTRIVAPATVGIKEIKDVLWVAGLPASRTQHVMDLVQPAVSQLTPMTNVLEVGLYCTNPFSHVPTALLNWARVEQDTGEHHFDWHDWTTPTTKRLGELMDVERGALLKGMGLPWIPLTEISRRMYGGRKWKIVPVTGEISASSRTIPPRYTDEDVPVGLVAFASLAKQFGVAMPVINLIIDFANLIRDQDYRQTGRTVETMGIAKMTPAQVLEMVNA